MCPLNWRNYEICHGSQLPVHGCHFTQAKPIKGPLVNEY